MTNTVDEIISADAAAMAGVAVTTWRSYVARGQAPEPHRRVGATPVWDRAVVAAWMASRPGQGARTDRRGGGKGLPPGSA